MMNSHGLTLIETLLVMVIAAVMMMMGVQQYNTYRNDTDVETVKYDVHLLFQALDKFYHANCGIAGGISGKPGLLAKAPTTEPFAVDIKTQLIETGFLNKNDLQFVAIVDQSAGDSYQGYFAQFNPIVIPRTVKAGPESKDTPIGNIVLWMPQVAIHLKDPDPDAAIRYKSMLGADCLSVKNRQLINACYHQPSPPSPPHPPPVHDYVVWQYIPSFAAWSAQSNYWVYTPIITQFNQMYSTYPMLYSISNASSNQQRFLCTQ